MFLRRFFNRKPKLQKINLYKQLKNNIQQQAQLLFNAMIHANNWDISKYSTRLLDLIRQLSIINEKYASQNNEIASSSLNLLKSLKEDIISKIKEIAHAQRAQYEEIFLEEYLSTFSYNNAEKNLLDLYKEIDKEIQYEESELNDIKLGKSKTTQSNEEQFIGAIIYNMNKEILAGINSFIVDQIKTNHIKLHPDLFPESKFPDVVTTEELGSSKLLEEIERIQIDIKHSVFPDYPTMYHSVTSNDSNFSQEIKEILQKLWEKQKELVQGKLTKETLLNFINSTINRINFLLGKISNESDKKTLSAIKVVYEHAQERLTPPSCEGNNIGSHRNAISK